MAYLNVKYQMDWSQHKNSTRERGRDATRRWTRNEPNVMEISKVSLWVSANENRAIVNSVNLHLCITPLCPFLDTVVALAADLESSKTFLCSAHSLLIFSWRFCRFFFPASRNKLQPEPVRKCNIFPFFGPFRFIRYCLPLTMRIPRTRT